MMLGIIRYVIVICSVCTVVICNDFYYCYIVTILLKLLVAGGSPVLASMLV
jgi:hypothetical protein